MCKILCYDLGMENTNKPIDEKSNAICKVMLSQVAEKLKSMRNSRGISIRAFSEMSGVSTAVISDFENQKYLPKMDILVRFALALDLSIGELLSSLAPSDEVVKTATCDNNEQAERFLMGMGLNAENMLEVLDYIAFKKSSFDRRNFFK